MMCRSCGHRLDDLLSLGPIVPSTYYGPGGVDPPALPLTLQRCWSCGLVQLDGSVDRETLYRQYWYRSGVNEVMQAELADVVQQAGTLVGGLGPADIVVDVGANDGTLLAQYAQQPQRWRPVRVAYEPARNLFTALRPHADIVVSEFFPSRVYQPPARSVKILTSIAMFYDLDDPRAFVREVDRLLTDDGVWVVQMQDLAHMVEQCAFDNIVHEHVAYYSLRAFETLLTDTDLVVTQVQERAINGGSLRLYVRRRRQPFDVASALRWTVYEDVWCTPAALEHFAWEVHERQRMIRATIEAVHDRHGTIDLYAASTKSSTLLQACRVDHREIRLAVERSPEKWGLVTSGTHIPIVSEATWRQDPAPVALLGAWQFAEAFIEREQAYLQAGGQFLVPLPVTRVVRGAREVA